MKSTNQGKDGVAPNSVDRGNFNFFFYKEKKYLKNDCLKCKNWLEKKGNLITYVYYETKLIDVSSNTW